MPSLVSLGTSTRPRLSSGAHRAQLDRERPALARPARGSSGMAHRPGTAVREEPGRCPPSEGIVRSAVSWSTSSCASLGPQIQSEAPALPTNTNTYTNTKPGRRPTPPSP